MTLPEGWEWMDEIPSGWSPPEELRRPTGVVGVDLPIRMLSSNTLGNDLIDLVGRLLSEGARFSIWFGSEAKRISSPEQLAILSLKADEQHHRVYEAWTSFTDAYRASRGRVAAFRSEEDALRRVLSDAVGVLAETRSLGGTVRRGSGSLAGESGGDSA
ncbi:hypothetical protein [Streptomyces sp. NPDC004286]|uniref:hypothetical protein n=1 Tax=Streptomyces sp. NPDC004286 TaxID=3364696 RepID=UPI0036C1D9F8